MDFEHSAVEHELAALLQDLRRSRRPVEAHLTRDASAGAGAQSAGQACLAALANQRLFDGALTTRCQAIACILERRSAELAKQL
jgi:hypothetical protein